MDKDLIAAMYQLEMAAGILASARHLEMDGGVDEMHLRTEHFSELTDRVWAALYIVQAAAGMKPSNYRRVMRKVLEHDAREDAAVAIVLAKVGPEGSPVDKWGSGEH